MGIMHDGLPVGKLFHIPIRIHVLLPIFVVIQVVFSAIYAQTGSNDVSSVKAAAYALILYGPILFATVLVHELGHCLACRQVGGVVDSILLWPLGGLAFIGHESGPGADLWVALAGPLTHIPMFLIWLFGLFLAQHAETGSWHISLSPSLDLQDHFGADICLGAVWLNIVLVAFNLLLPAYPLDGGRIFCDAMLLAGVPAVTAAYVTIGVAALIGVAIVVWGFVVSWPFTILVGLYMLYSTFQLYKYVQSGMVSEHPLFRFSVRQEETYQAKDDYEPGRV